MNLKSNLTLLTVIFVAALLFFSMWNLIESLLIKKNDLVSSKYPLITVQYTSTEILDIVFDNGSN